MLAIDLPGGKPGSGSTVADRRACARCSRGEDRSSRLLPDRSGKTNAVDERSAGSDRRSTLEGGHDFARHVGRRYRQSCSAVTDRTTMRAVFRHRRARARRERSCSAGPASMSLGAATQECGSPSPGPPIIEVSSTPPASRSRRSLSTGRRPVARESPAARRARTCGRARPSRSGISAPHDTRRPVRTAAQGSRAIAVDEAKRHSCSAWAVPTAGPDAEGRSRLVAGSKPRRRRCRASSRGDPAEASPHDLAGHRASIGTSGEFVGAAHEPARARGLRAAQAHRASSSRGRCRSSPPYDVRRTRYVLRYRTHGLS